MSEIEELRKVKDDAGKALAKKQFDKAAALYLEIAERDPDADWYQRAGDALRRAGKNERAIECMSTAARGYAQQGFLLKAIAVGKTILQIEPKHTATQKMLAELYAKRDQASAPAPVKPATAASSPFWPKVEAPAEGSRAMPVYPAVYPETPVYPAASAPTPAVYPEPPPPRTPAPKRGSAGAMPTPMPAVDALLGSRADSPIDALPLRQVLPHRRSGQFAIVDIDAAVAKPAVEAPGAYEIALEDSDFDFEVSVSPPPARAQAKATAEDLDFGDLIVEDPRPALPKIPLFSSLAEDELRVLIDRMTLRQLEPGEVIIRQGERGGSLFVIVDGEVSVVAGLGMTVAPAKGAPRQLARLGAGAFFGEMGLLTDDPRSATVTATATTRVLEISRELSWDILRRSPEVLRTIMRFFRDRMLDRLMGSSPLFSMLSPEDARALAGHFIFLELETGMVPIKQGERSPGLFFLTCGAAEAVRDGVRLGSLGPGDVFGEMSLLLRTPASADVRVLKKCWVLELPQPRFQGIMLMYPQVLAYVSELGAQRRQKLDEEDADEAYSRIEIV